MKREILGINKTIKQAGPIKTLEQIIENARLDEVSAIIEHEISRFNRKSHHISMNLEITRIDDETIDQRQIHQHTVEGISTLLAQKLGLNTNLVKAMAAMHDSGHTFLGHDGEYMISEFMEKHEIGLLRHNARAIRELLYRQRIQEDIMDSIKSLNPEYSKNKLEKIRRSLWKVFDGIQAHNGESTHSEFYPNISKTEEEFLEETMRCYTELGFDKKIVPATPEACLLKLSDIIAYVGRDLVDGLKSGILTSLDEEYVHLLGEFGITQEELEQWITTKKYDKIDRVIQLALVRDVIENSHKSPIKTNTKVRLSPEMSKNMYLLRDKNYREVGAKTIKETEKSIFPQGIEELSTYFADLMTKENLTKQLSDLSENEEVSNRLRKKYVGTIYEGFIDYLLETTPEDVSFIKELINKTAEINGKYIPPEEMDRKIELFMGSNYLANLNDIEFIKLLTPINKITEEQYQNIMTSYRKSSEYSVVSNQFIQMIDAQRHDMKHQGIDQER